MRRTSTLFHPLFMVVMFAGWGIPYAGKGQQTKGKDLVAQELANRDAHTPNLPKGVSKSWYAEAVARIRERELYMHPGAVPGEFSAINHEQHLGYVFSPEGYAVGSFNDDGSAEGTWHNKFIVEGIGRKGQLHKSPLRQVSQMGDVSVQYDHSDYAVTYDNRRQGMEQTFLLMKRPAGHSELQIVLGLAGDLQAKMGKGDQLLLYKEGDPQEIKLMYDQFRVWDAAKKPLPAHMRLTPEHRVVLTVDDRNAAYPLTVDPLNHAANLSIGLGNVLGSGLNESASPALAGYSVTGVKDVNGDGADEIVVGAPLFTTVGSIVGGVLTLTGIVKGAAFVYFGVPAGLPSTTPSQVLQAAGLPTGALFGFSLASADLDNDGKGDVIVGAPGDVSPFNGSFKTGNVYVYRGANLSSNVNLQPTPSAKIYYGTSALDLAAITNNMLFGFSVANGGKINNDAIDDLLIGAPGSVLGAGAAYIYNGTGATTPVGSTPTTTIGGIAGSLFGYSVSGAGSVNNDAYADIIVGGPGAALTPSGFAGKAYVFFASGAGTGIANTNVLAASQILSPGASLLTTLFGYSVSSGDFNNDGKGDVIVGEPLYVTLGGAVGRAHIYYGTNTAGGLTTATHSVLTSDRGAANLNTMFGYSVSGGDVNGDGIDDALVGEPGGLAINGLLSGVLGTLGLNAAVNVPNGKAYAFYGSGSGIANAATANFTYFDNSGVAVDVLGGVVKGGYDYNADGNKDMLVSGPSGALSLNANLSAVSTALGATLGLGSSGSNASGQAGNVYLFLGGTGALPVTLLDFTAVADHGRSLLSWSTAQEQNSDGFEVQRSADGISYSNIGEVAASHNTTVRMDYSYTDAGPLPGANYYRLKMVDLDGQFRYSQVAVVNFASGGAKVITAYPNPAHGRFSLELKNMTPGSYRISVLSVAGQEVMKRELRVGSGLRHVETVNMPTVAAGSYWIRIMDAQHHSYLTRLEVQ